VRKKERSEIGLQESLKKIKGEKEENEADL
jgi:hypothetical protein